MSTYSKLQQVDTFYDDAKHNNVRSRSDIDYRVTITNRHGHSIVLDATSIDYELIADDEILVHLNVVNKAD